ncbi:MAG: hypothetical protein OWS74_03490 [Firmicutes bacterium]|nr:hypothetical protein [Bacillota bacterium]
MKLEKVRFFHPEKPEVVLIEVGPMEVSVDEFIRLMVSGFAEITKIMVQGGMKLPFGIGEEKKTNA